jgi:hypothetical protein
MELQSQQNGPSAMTTPSFVSTGAGQRSNNGLL